ncbi:hypothetical protein [Wenjunlia tyrosinilytica]|uniref:Uncharacterized protein n=1 Tax=Wenjunlia tyrosinilytica TaxID=1544741 RepID=A0A917ZY35_9ACTN|nr:hypothetical protein [Wenjunlia tyrosinilytica]GGO98063.1 hypothetical protein GCM10012280_61320 [Wenjunlia tyrosinilytica]
MSRTSAERRAKARSAQAGRKPAATSAASASPAGAKGAKAATAAKSAAGKSARTAASATPAATRGAKAATAAESSLWSLVMPHVKVALVLGLWLAMLRQQALPLADFPRFYAQALVASASLALCAAVAVYLYPPLTPRWRTIMWTLVVSTVVGTAMHAAVGGRFGLLAALLSGGAVLAARCNGTARTAVRHLRERRRSAAERA